MADPSTALGLLGDPSSLQNLDDEMVKLIGYNIVSLEYGNEQVVKQGEGTMIVVERMSREQFVSYTIAKWLDAVSKLPEPDLTNALKLEHSTLDVHFVVVRRWPRRNPKFYKRRTEALDQIRKTLETGGPGGKSTR